MARVTVLYFAAARERAGCASEVLEVQDGATAADVLELAFSRHPALMPLRPHLRVAVDEAFSDLTDRIKDGSEVALIPPVSGGSGAFRVSGTALALDAVISAVGGEETGGVVTFTGQVRNQTRGRRVLRLEYEAYAPMAERVLAQIGAEAAERWPGARLAIHHRTGVLHPGEAAVVIAAAAPHRAEAFDACRHAIERLKADAPIWKKEFFEDGEVWVGLGP